MGSLRSERFELYDTTTTVLRYKDFYDYGIDKLEILTLPECKH
jgi:hypothetical protein